MTVAGPYDHFTLAQIVAATGCSEANVALVGRHGAVNESDVTPRLPVENGLHALPAHPVALRQDSRAEPAPPATVETARLQDFCGRHFGPAAPFPDSPNLRASMLRTPVADRRPSLRDHVIHVLLVRSKPQVDVIDTSRIIALGAVVQNVKAVRYRTVGANPGKVVRSQAIAADVERPVAGVIQITPEQQASTDSFCLRIEPTGIGREEDAATGRFKTALRRTKRASNQRAFLAIAPQAQRGIIQPWHGTILRVTVPSAVCAARGLLAGIIP